jgi:hypothetical protein
LFFLHPEPRPHPLVNPLAHASDYYCLGTGNVTLDNYEADTRHFPVKYRKGIRRGRNFWTTYPNQGVVDVVISWQSAGNPPPRGPAGWDEVFHQGALRIYRRPQKN